MSRFTVKELRREIDGINEFLKKYTDTYLVVGARYGYYGLDIYNKNTDSCLQTYQTGTARELLVAANAYAGSKARQLVRKLTSGMSQEQIEDIIK